MLLMRFIRSIGLGASLVVAPVYAQIPSADSGPPPAAHATVILPPYHFTWALDAEVLVADACPAGVLGQVTNEIQNHSKTPLPLRWPAANIVLGKQRALPHGGIASVPIPVPAKEFQLAQGELQLGQYFQDVVTAYTYTPQEYAEECSRSDSASYPTFLSRLVFDTMRVAGPVRLELELSSRPITDEKLGHAIEFEARAESAVDLLVGMQYLAFPADRFEPMLYSALMKRHEFAALVDNLDAELHGALSENVLYDKYWFLKIGPKQPSASLALPWEPSQQTLEHRTVRVFALDGEGQIVASGLVAVWVPSAPAK